jgi:uroporphyrinogen-III decarboxylase
VDFGATHVTGISASTLSKIRRAILGDQDFRVKIIEPYQMLGEIDDELKEALGIDIVGIMPPKTMFGFENTDFKPFTMFDGTEVLVAGDFNVKDDGKGGWYIYPQGDTSVPPSARMPKDGYYFDATFRQGPIDDENLNPADNLVEFGELTPRDIQPLVAHADKAIQAEKGTILSAPGMGFGDIALVPATWMKHTPGIRDVEEWYISTVTRKDYIFKVFEAQCQIALKNLRLLIDTLGDKVQAVFTTGTDFGTQNAAFISPQAYRGLFKPFHKIVNDFIHSNSNWKIFIHSCGAINELIPDFIDAGFDILNPVQCSAAGMDPQKLKDEYGKDLIFWGGGVNTQKTLPFGTPQEVYDEVRQRIKIFNNPPGMVFNSIHNIQAKTPIENLLAMFKAVRESAK